MIPKDLVGKKTTDPHHSGLESPTPHVSLKTSTNGPDAPAPGPSSSYQLFETAFYQNADPDTQKPPTRSTHQPQPTIKPRRHTNLFLLPSTLSPSPPRHSHLSHPPQLRLAAPRGGEGGVGSAVTPIPQPPPIHQHQFTKPQPPSQRSRLSALQSNPTTHQTKLKHGESLPHATPPIPQPPSIQQNKLTNPTPTPLSPIAHPATTSSRDP